MMPSPLPTSPRLFFPRLGDGPAPPSPIPDFEVEHATSRVPRTVRSVYRTSPTERDDEVILQARVDDLLLATSRPFTISGHLHVDPASFALFFKTDGGVAHSLEFPINVTTDTPPALDVLIASSIPHNPSGLSNYTPLDALSYPADLPLTTTFELAHHPILGAIKRTLLPLLPEGHHLVAQRDRLTTLVTGARLTVPSPSLPSPSSPLPADDGRCATVILTLPVAYRGGALVVRRTFDGAEELYDDPERKGDEIEWVAFSSECEWRVEPVTKGCRMMISYGVYAQSYGPLNPLADPSERVLDALAPILRQMRGRSIGFFLSNDYNVNPADVLADAVVPLLKGSDSLFYDAFRSFKLTPELRWTAGGYVWPVDRPVDCERSDMPLLSSPTMRAPVDPYGRPGTMSPRGVRSPAEDLRTRVAQSTALTLAEAGIWILQGSNAPGMIGRQRVPFVSGGELENMVVNILLVVYVA